MIDREGIPDSVPTYRSIMAGRRGSPPGDSAPGKHPAAATTTLSVAIHGRRYLRATSLLISTSTRRSR